MTVPVVEAKLIYTYPMAMTGPLYICTVIHRCLRPWFSRSMCITMSMPMTYENACDWGWVRCDVIYLHFFQFFVVISPLPVNWCMPCPLHVVCVFCSVPIHIHSFLFFQLLHLHPLRVRSQYDKMADRLHSQNNFVSPSSGFRSMTSTIAHLHGIGLLLKSDVFCGHHHCGVYNGIGQFFISDDSS